MVAFQFSAVDSCPDGQRRLVSAPKELFWKNVCNKVQTAIAHQAGKRWNVDSECKIKAHCLNAGALHSCARCAKSKVRQNESKTKADHEIIREVLADSFSLPFVDLHGLRLMAMIWPFDPQQGDDRQWSSWQSWTTNGSQIENGELGVEG